MPNAQAHHRVREISPPLRADKEQMNVADSGRIFFSFSFLAHQALSIMEISGNQAFNRDCPPGLPSECSH